MPRIPLVLPANLNQMAEEVLFATYVPEKILDPYETKFCRLTWLSNLKRARLNSSEPQFKGFLFFKIGDIDYDYDKVIGLINFNDLRNYFCTFFLTL